MHENNALFVSEFYTTNFVVYTTNFVVYTTKFVVYKT